MACWNGRNSTMQSMLRASWRRRGVAHASSASAAVLRSCRYNECAGQHLKCGSYTMSSTVQATSEPVCQFRRPFESSSSASPLTPSIFEESTSSAWASHSHLFHQRVQQQEKRNCAMLGTYRERAEDLCETVLGVSDSKHRARRSKY